ncbi:MAG: tetratricopeptide repeat protein [Bacteroidota bacterium]
MNRKPFFLILTTLLALSTFPFAAAQNMDMNAVTPQAKVEIRNALDMIGHDMIAFTEYVEDAYKLDSTMPVANAFLALDPLKAEYCAQHVMRFNAFEGEYTKVELLFKDMLGQLANPSFKMSSMGEQFTDLHPEDGGLHAFVGYMYQLNERPRLAIKHYQRAIALSNHAGAHNLLGYAYLEANRLELAKQSFVSYLAAYPDHPNPYDSMGDYFMKVEKYDEAVEAYEQALKLSPGSNFAAKKAEEARAKMK